MDRFPSRNAAYSTTNCWPSLVGRSDNGYTHTSGGETCYNISFEERDKNLLISLGQYDLETVGQSHGLVLRVDLSAADLRS